MGQATAATKTKPNLITRYVPLLGWLPGYDRGWLRPDFLAGLTVVALLVPEGMAYAELAGCRPRRPFTPPSRPCFYTPFSVLPGNWW